MKINLFRLSYEAYPNCKPCNGDINTVTLYDYKDDKRYYKSIDFHENDLVVSNIYHIPYDEFLDLISVFGEKAKDLPEIEMKPKTVAKD